jgi:dimethylargininase
MSLVAITRAVSPSINKCELSFQTRQPIDVSKAIAQHKAYEDCLAQAGAKIISLPAEPELPDAVFVEDSTVVLDEIAIIANPGALSRRAETGSVAAALAPYRPLIFITDPATLDGGDVLPIDRTIFIGLSQRTNRAGVEQMRELLGDYGYEIEAIEVKGCLHLKSACSYIGHNTILLHRPWIEAERLSGYELLDVDGDEPDAANALLLNDVVITPASFPKTLAKLGALGFRVHAIDVSELQKAEAGVTCCSLTFLADEKENPLRAGANG